MTAEKKIFPKQPLTDQEAKLLALVDEHQDQLVKLLQDLVRIESLNLSEYEFCDRSEIFEFTGKRMQEAGFETTFYKAPFPNGEEDQFYYNLIASYNGNKPGKTLQFNGHLDTVPYNEEKWNPKTPPLGGVINDGKLYGRGAIDMKAGVACQMMAMKIFKDSGVDFKGKLQMWFTPDEETHGAFGSAFMSEHYLNAIRANATIISEPSSMKPLESPAIGIGEKGPHWLKFTFFGAAGHGSMPKEKSNALNKAVRFMANAKKGLKIPKRKIPMSLFSFLRSLLSRYPILELRKMELTTGDEINPLDKDKLKLSALFETTFSFDKIQAGNKTNVIPDTCDLEVDFRVMPGLTTQELFDALVKYCTRLGYRIELPDGYSNLQHELKNFRNEPVDIQLSILTIGDGSYMDVQSEFGRCLSYAFEAVYETSPVPIFIPGFTDAGNMREAGLEDIFILGPGGGNAHDANEYVDLETMVDITKMYLLVAYRYLTAHYQ